jgi:hypothetical protein
MDLLVILRASNMSSFQRWIENGIWMTWLHYRLCCESSQVAEGLRPKMPP